MFFFIYFLIAYVLLFTFLSLQRVFCLFAQVCKRKNPISESRLDLAVILVMSRYEHDTLPVNSEQ